MINVRKLISVSVQMNLWACEIVRDLLNDQSLKKYEKGVNDPVTEADFKIQSMLIKGLRIFFPDLKIIGEQSTEYQGKIQFDYKTLNQSFLPPEIKIQEQLPIDKVCLWIDPIDNTKGFIKGVANQVTILMGLSFNGKASVGIIGLPFVKKENKQQYNPVILFGSVLSKSAYKYNYFSKSYEVLSLPVYDQNKQITIVTSDNRFTAAQKEFVELMKAGNITSGGSGKKFTMVILQEADMMAYLNAQNHKWDTCGAEAIINAMGGFMVDTSNQPLNYDPSNSDTYNKNGIIATLQPELYKRALQTGVIKK